ncbi:glycosyltransferase family 4 protein [Shewanella colwelliana]|uniref:glycosyltransferase family 4 protein n=1 Tax=Shewanella colwelliana TaxID=23 RepID=UPI003735522E
MDIKKNVLFLYSEIGPYNLPVFMELVNRFDCNVHVVRWDKNCLKPYTPKPTVGVTYYNRSEYDEVSLDKLLKAISPVIIYVSGWMDKLYLKCSLKIKKTGVPVVSGFDDIWLGSFRQKLGKYYFKFFLHKYFSHAWVAGECQFEFARQLGFPKEKIIFDLLSADVKVFDKSNYVGFGGDFLYVGNFKTVKGTHVLIEAFIHYKNSLNGQCGLTCIGNGELKDDLLLVDGITVVDYMEQIELIEMVSQSIAFILPSTHDQWGVVVHEFASAGMPLILSSGVGSSTKFLIDGLNGFSFENGSFEELAMKMKMFESLDVCKRIMMSEHSKLLSKRVSPTTSAANFISIVRAI